MAIRFASAVIVLSLIAAAIVGLHRRHQSAAAFYASALRQTATSERISWQGSTYEIAHGEVFHDGVRIRGTRSLVPLQLAYAASLAERNPIMALPGVSLDEFDDALDRMQRTQARLAAKQTSAFDASLVSEHLYPIAFLRAALELERARREFVGSPAMSSMRRYENLLRVAVLAYRSDLRDFSAAFRSAVPENAPDYAAQRYIITRDDTLAALTYIDKAATITERQVRDRSQCVSGNVVFCDADELSLPTFTSLDVVTIPSPNSLRDVRAALDESGVTLEPGPDVLLSNSYCVRGAAGPVVYAIERLSRAGADLAYPSPILASDITLVDATEYDEYPFFSYFTDNGATYVPLRDLAYYTCPRAGMEQGRVLATLRVAETASVVQASDLADGALRTELQALETELANPRMVTEASATRYLNAVQPLLGEDGLAENARKTLLDAMLVMRTASPGTLQVMRDIVLFEETDMLLATQGIDFDFGSRYLFYVRSGFLPLFLANNPTVIPLHLPLFSPNILPQTSQPYRSFLSLQGDERDQAISDMTLYYRTHQSP